MNNAGLSNEMSVLEGIPILNLFVVGPSKFKIFQLRSLSKLSVKGNDKGVLAVLNVDWTQAFSDKLQLDFTQR